MFNEILIRPYIKKGEKGRPKHIPSQIKMCTLAYLIHFACEVAFYIYRSQWHDLCIVDTDTVVPSQL